MMTSGQVKHEEVQYRSLACEVIDRIRAQTARWAGNQVMKRVSYIDHTLNLCEIRLWVQTWEKVRARVEDQVRFSPSELR